MRGTYQRGSQECVPGKKKITSSHTKSRRLFLQSRTSLEQELKSVVAKAGYDVISVNSQPYEKKGCSLHSGGDIMQMEVLQGILIPFLGTTLGSACVLFMKKSF